MSFIYTIFNRKYKLRVFSTFFDFPGIYNYLQSWGTTCHPSLFLLLRSYPELTTSILYFNLLNVIEGEDSGVLNSTRDAV